jgi:hypothetical protein
MANQYDAIDKFLARNAEAVKAQAKELRLTPAESAALAAAISQLLGRNGSLYEQLLSLQNQLITQQKATIEAQKTQVVTVALDGGEF